MSSSLAGETKGPGKEKEKAEPAAVEEIKTLLKDILNSSICVIPADKIDLHPFEWLKQEMSHVILQLQQVKEKIRERTEEKIQVIEALEKEKRDLQKALSLPEIEYTPWGIESNLCIKENMLYEVVKEYRGAYKVQKEKYQESIEQIRKLIQKIGEDIKYQEIEEAEIIDKKAVAEAESTVKELTQKLNMLREETEKKKTALFSLLQEIGISVYTPEDVLACLNAVQKNSKEIGKLPNVSKLSITDTITTIQYSPSEARKCLEEAKAVQISLKHRETQLLARIKALREAMPEIEIAAHIEKDIKNNLHPLITRVDMLSNAVSEAEEIYINRISAIYQKYQLKHKEQIEQIEEITQKKQSVTVFPPIEGLSFAEQESLLAEIRSKTDALEKESCILNKIKGFIKEREELLKRMSAFEEAASDPQRLFRSSFQLVFEEKFRKMAVPTLLRVEKEIFMLAEEYASLSNYPVLINGHQVIEELREHISQRIINTNVFLTRIKTPAPGTR